MEIQRHENTSFKIIRFGGLFFFFFNLSLAYN